MKGRRPMWLGRELIGIPADARVVFVSGQDIAVVAVPMWKTWVVTLDGAIAAPDDLCNQSILSSYFGSLADGVADPVA